MLRVAMAICRSSHFGPEIETYRLFVPAPNDKSDSIADMKCPGKRQIWQKGLRWFLTGLKENERVDTHDSGTY